MFDPALLRRVPLKEVPGGHLLLHLVDGKQCIGMAVQAPGEDDEKGVLLFPPVPWAGALSNGPFFSWATDRVIHLGVAAEFFWPGNFTGLSDSFHQIPPAGHLVVTPNGVSISGRMQTGLGRPIYWDIKTGTLSRNQDVAGEKFVFISEWSVGWRDTERKFHVLGKFPVTTLASLLNEATKK